MRTSRELGYLAPIKNIKGIGYCYEDPNYRITNNPLTEADIQTLEEVVKLIEQFKGFKFFDSKLIYKGRSWLVWEHTTPLKEFIEKLKMCKNEKEVRSVMNDYSGVYWISRAEDDALRAHGYSNKRPGGWRRCYNKCGIRVIYCDDIRKNRVKVKCPGKPEK